ncbi:MAG: NUDIX hydrolase [Dehalococcoidia bacterium]|nr:NUDIX hydrolase [Dehalococcoidia bacterium]
MSAAPDAARRELAVAVFVVHDELVLLHRHKKLDMWLPPGGHIEPGELPDEAALRETKEEAGLDIVLVDTLEDPRSAPPGPQRLCRPLGIQLEDIPPDHQHIDLIYAAVPSDSIPPRLTGEGEANGMGWYPLAEFRRIGVSEEVARWSEAAYRAVEGRRRAGAGADLQ